MKRQNTVGAYLKSTQLLPFGIAIQAIVSVVIAFALIEYFIAALSKHETLTQCLD